MTNRIFIHVMSSVVALAGQIACAQAGTKFKIIVDRSSTSGCSGQQTTTYYDQSTPLTFSVPTCATRVAILGGELTNHSDATDNDIPKITLTGGPSTWPLEVVLGTSFVATDAAPPEAAHDWAGLDASGLAGTSQFSGAIAGNLTGSIVGLDSLSRFDVGGAITATTSASTEIAVGAPYLSVFVVEAGSLNSVDSSRRARIVLSSGSITRVRSNGNMGGDIVGSSGNILDVQITGNLSGSVTAASGRIDRIAVTGAISAPDLSGGVPPIRCRTGIGSLTAGSISSNISTNTNSGDGPIQFMQATSFSGNMATDGVRSFLTGSSGLTINGDLSGQIRARHDVVKPITITGSVTSTGVISVGNSLIDDATNDGRITIGTSSGGSLAGQIRIRRYTSESGTWSGDVRIGGSSGTLLSPTPYYNNLSSSIGGGAVGLLPFAVHDLDCSPQNYEFDDPSILQTGFNQTVTAQPVTLRFYGPVRTDAATASPVKIEHLFGSSVIDVTPYCTVTVKRGSQSGTSREVVIIGNSGHYFLPGFYKITPVLTGTSTLYCDAGPGTPEKPPVYDFVYYFKMQWDCDGNGVDDAYQIAHCNGQCDTTPLDGFLDVCTNWNALGCPADVNGDGFVNGDDYDAFSAAFDESLPEADFNVDGFVNGDDYDFFAARFDVAC